MKKIKQIIRKRPCIIDPVSALLLSLKMWQCCKEAPALLKYSHGGTKDEFLCSKDKNKKS